MYIHTHTHTHTYMHIYTYTYVCIYICIYMHIHTHTYIHTHTVRNIHIHTCTYTHTHTHTNTHTHSKEYILTSQDRAFINQSERMLGINNWNEYIMCTRWASVPSLSTSLSSSLQFLLLPWLGMRTDPTGSLRLPVVEDSNISRLKIRFWGFPGGAVVENLPANAGDAGSSPGLGRSHVPQSN